MNIARTLLCILCLAMCLSGCGADESVPGVMATVNGKPITLGNVEFHYDLRHIESGDVANPTVDQLRLDYGDILADLIVQELIFQELTKAGQEVSDEKLQAVEDQVRADYPGDSFKEMLIEENIDLDRWREGVRARLAVEIFFDKILKDKVKVEVQEAADYYKEHLADFNRPEKISFILAFAPDAEQVNEVLKTLGDNPDPATLPEPKGGVGARVISLRPENLPHSWEKALKGLKRGEASNILSGDMGFEALIFLENIPARTLDAAQAYPLVEERILKRKLQEAFTLWLREAVGNAKILVSSRLMGDEAGADDPGEKPALKEDFASRLPLQPGNEADTDIDEQVRRTVADKLRREEGAQPVLNGAPAKDSEESQAGRTGDDAAEMAASSGEKKGDDGQTGATAESAAPSGNEELKAPEAAKAPEKTADAETPSVAPEIEKVEDAGQNAAPAPTVVEKSASVPLEEPGEVEFTANKASWIILTADGGKEEKIYVKGGKTHKATFTKSLKARMGSPSDVTYRYKGQETQVVSSAKEVKILEFPQ